MLRHSSDELPAHLPDGRAVVLAEVRYGLEVRRQPSGQPDQLHVSLRLALQAPARLDAVQIPVDVDLQQRGRVIRRAAGDFRLSALKTQIFQIQLIDEHVDDSDRIILGDVLVQALGE